jgi:hypothetical protein
VKDENDDLLADSHSILNRGKNYFSHLLNVQLSSGQSSEVPGSIPGATRFSEK